MPAEPPAATPYVRLSGFYFFYFASIGAFLPFWSLYLEELAFTPKQIGELLAVTLATKVVAPVIWGWIADHTGRRASIIRIAALAAAVIFSASLAVTGYWGMLAVLGAFSFFWNAALPQFEAATMDHLGDGIHLYSSIRLWGSVGFIVAVTTLGPVLERFGMDWLPWIMLALLTAIWINSLLVAEHNGKSHQGSASLGQVLRKPPVAALLLASFLLQASHGAYYTFFSIYMEDHGYTRGMIGGLWALGVIAEIAVFLGMSHWLPRFGARALLLAAMVGAVLRWLLIATLAHSLLAMLVAQILHAATFGLSHAAAMYLIYGLFPGNLRGRGQAFYAAMGLGLGGALGSLMSGYVWTAISPQSAYVAAALLAAAGVLVVWRGVAT